MANEIKVQASLEVDNGNYKQPKVGTSLQQFDQSNEGGGVPGIVNATTAGVDVDLSALTSEGWVRLHNTDGTNYVQWGPKSGGTFYPIGRLEPNEPALFRMEPGTVLHLKADTATCLVQVLAMEN